MNNLINIENRAGKIKLNDSVHKDSADQLIQELEQLYGESAVASNMQIGDITCSAENALESVDVEINSPGGSVMEGQRIFNALKGISARGVEVVTTVNGLAASMGSVILMAGDQRKMTAGSRIMIHDASVMAYGNADDLRKQSNLLESISSEIADIYAEKANGNAQEIRELMKDETWMDTAQAKELGFVDSIIKNGKEQDTENELNSNQLITNKQSMFTKDKDLVAKLEASQAEVSEHEATIARREAEAVTLSEDLSAAKAELVENQTQITELTAKLETSEAIVKDQGEFSAKVEDAAQAKLAEIGHPAPVAVDDSEVTLSVYEQYKELKATDPTKAGAFWRENEAAIKASV